ncbi:MAG TPA: helicase-related protein [Gemmataceae bacterium]|nr:helicase-related protein [Gemmataceae bacterium]
MATLEEITRGAAVKGILPEGLVTISDVRWIGTVAIEVTYKDTSGRLGNELLYRDREATLEIAAGGRPWSFDGDGGLFRLLSEANRIRLAYLFDPLLAVHTSLVDPLPHQITAVYGEMLSRQPLRFLLADDPGAGKTIMTGLLTKELSARGDLQRCLIVCPGNLVEQWQDEMDRRFHLPFEIMTNDALEAARTGNWFSENPLAICRLDKLSRNEDVQSKLRQTDWDLIVCDEAHKLSATYFGNEVKYTKRYRLGQLLSTLTRHFLLLTATPHNGKEADFQLFMALLDGDRFEGKFRDGVHLADASDMMRRLVKEHLLKFDGTPLFPERRAYTVNYALSDAEAELYKEVTGYVREEFNRAEALENDGRKGTVGFALTILQRRLASSPEAIYQSLRRRRERLEKRLREEQLLKRGAEVAVDLNAGLPVLTQDDLEDLDDAPDTEIEETEERVVDQASAARTITELQAEIAQLQDLERAALRVRQSATDRKWDELSRLLQNNSAMFDSEGSRRKLVIFTEHRDTLNYLAERIRALVGKPEAIVIIHGGIGREDRRKAQESFTHDKEVEILVATDAAGEGINLQRAHLMVNYDLPWNPNRLEQRFGRIHRIGQTEVCHLWNLVAKDTREGEVYFRLLEKLDEERKALGGQVFDVLGQLTFEDRPLRDLLLDAIRYGDKPEVKARLFQVVDKALDREHLRELVESRALTHDSMDVTKVRQIREDMERADARRLQPHFIASFFMEAFKLLGGTIHEREPKRYEVKHVPAVIRNRDREIGRGEAVLQRYERITFEKSLISVPGKPLAGFVCPGHPLLDATLDIIIERHRDLLKRGAILIDDTDEGDQPRALLYLEHGIQDARTDRAGNRRIVSKRLQFVEVKADGQTTNAGPAPYLDYRPPAADENAAIQRLQSPDWMRNDLEARAMEHAAIHLVPQHLDEVRHRKEELIDKTRAAVQDRLTKEINYWDHRAAQLKDQELAGKVNAKLNSGLARQRADDLTARLQKRLTELEQERKLSPLPPVVLGGALIVPAGLLRKLQGKGDSVPPTFAQDTEQSERLAMQAAMDAERKLGNVPRDVSDQNLGYDIESAIPGTGLLRFIEVKGRVRGAKTVTITKNEILTGLNKPDEFILAVCIIDGQNVEVRHIRKPFVREPDFGATSVNYELDTLLAQAKEPA